MGRGSDINRMTLWERVPALLLAFILLLGFPHAVGADPASPSAPTTGVSSSPSPPPPGPSPVPPAAGPDGGHMSLYDAVRTAVQRNLSLEALSLGPAIGNAGIGVAKSAFKPIPFFTGSHSIVSQAFSQALGDFFVDDVSAVGTRRVLEDGSSYLLQYQLRQIQSLNFNNTLATLFLAVTRPLKRGGGRDATLAPVNAAADVQQQGTQGVNLAAQALVTRVEAAYWQLGQTQKILEATEKSILQYQHLLEVTEARIKAGDAAPYESLAVSQQLAVSRHNVIVARQDVNLADLQMRRLLRLDLSGPPLTVDSFPTSPSHAEDVTHLIEVAEQHRPEIEQAVLVAHTLHLQTLVSQNLALEREDLTFNVEADPASPGTNEMRLAFQYERPTSRAGVLEAQLREQQALVTAQDVVRQVDEDVAASARALTYLSDKLNAASEVRKLSETLAVAEILRYEAGLTAINVVLDSQRQMQDAVAVEAQAASDYATGVADLDRATGVALEKYGISVASVSDRALPGPTPVPVPTTVH